ncbi:Na(+)/H(+) exchange regulatory cofactor NHE-RF2 [Nelusetta ayraudi]|uniref:Na(+)/H(+) exchange regulatory cofactor NHE-RF2 n=1 Tax=Nelusetta ayraudi TaxID=303726 RepID=UPI003F726D8B
METELRPRLCFLTKGDRGYGFHLHGERNKGGQFIRKVEPGSPADHGGLRPGDRVVEVNGENVEDESHHQVVDLIREVPHRTRLLVVDRETDGFLRSRGLPCTEDLAMEMGNLSPRPSPGHTPSNSPLPRGISPLMSKVFHLSSLAASSPTDSAALGGAEASSETSSEASDAEVPVQLSPELPAEHLPRLCCLVKGDNDYGFYLHSYKTRSGQYVRLVEPGSAAEIADVRPGDRIMEVNDVDIQGLRHSEVVELIQAAGDEVRLLVVDPETDELYLNLGLMPTTSSQDKEVSLGVTETTPLTPTPTTETAAADQPVINITDTDSPAMQTSSDSWPNRSSASQSSVSSATHSEVSSSDMSIQVADEDERRVSDPFVDNGLRLSPTAAEAKQRAVGSRSRRRAPGMDWGKRREIFNNF